MIWLILLISLVLRVIVLDQSLWWDEAINVVAAKNLTLWQFILSYPIGDFHPPGYFLILWYWSHFFGFGEAVVRIPSVILGVATVWLTFLLGKRLFEKKVGYLASFLLTIAPLHIYYSQEARMYALAAFSSSLNWYFFTKINEKKFLIILGFIISVVLVIYSDYVAWLIFPAQLGYIVWTRRIHLRKFLSLVGVGILFFIPWLKIFPLQLASGQEAAASLPGWGSVVGGANLRELLLVFVKTIIGRVSIANKLVYQSVMVVLGLFYLTIIVAAIKKLDRNIKLLLLWITIPLTLAFLISYFIPVLTYFRMLFILPAFYLLVAKGLVSLPRLYFKGAFLIVVLTSLVSLVTYYTNPKFQREDWRGVSQFIQKEHGLILFENNHLPAPVIYYLDSTSSLEAALTNVPAKTKNDLKKIPDVKTVYLVEYLVEITDPQRLLESQLIAQGFGKKKVYNFTGVGLVTQFSRF